MASTPTLDLAKPAVDGPETDNTWGYDLNDNFDKLDLWAAGINAKPGEAPTDGKKYARMNSTWVEITLEGTVSWGDIAGKPSTFPPSAHTHPLSDVEGLVASLDEVDDDLTALDLRVTDLENASGAVVNWADVQGKPSTFPPSAHTHDWADITGEPASFPPSAHTHLWADITDKPTTFAPSAHTHNASDINAGTLALARIPVAASGVSNATSVPRADDSRLSDARTPTAHQHNASDINAGTLGIARIPVAADGVSNTTSVPRADDSRLSNARAPTTHTHAQSEITNLTTDLAAKAPLASPALTGNPTAPTPATSDNDTSIATTAFVKAQNYLTDAPSDGTTYARKDGAWIAAVGGGGASVTISDTAPGSPTAGSLWWESDTGKFWIYYTDANTSQWIEAAGPSAGGQPVDWSLLTGVPSTFAPSAHTHPQSEVTNLTTDLSNKQPLDATLTALAGLNTTAGLLEQTGTDTFTKRAIGVGATTSIPTRADGDTRWAAASHTHAQADITNLTTDLAAKAPLASPALTGNPTAPTPTAGDNDTSIATTAFVTTAVATKEPTISAGTTSQYWRGDKSWQNAGTIIGRNLTISTSAPSGGADGDIWFVVT